MLEKISPQLRHALIALLASSITLGIKYVHSLHFSAPVQALVGAGITALTLIVTPLTNQYGITELNSESKK